jgi:multidrug efflux pump subunit AcrA (membrane-fusion protein)
MATHTRSRVIRRTIIVTVIITVLGLGATTAVALGSSTSPAYRTATVTAGLVTEQLPGTGTIQPVTEAAVAFPIAGTVASVDVTVGAHVSVGQQLATLDAGTLSQNLLTTQAALAAANLTLYDALNGQSSPNPSSTGHTSSSTGPTSTGGQTSTASAGNATSAQGTSPALSTAQQQLLTAQRKVDAAMATAQVALNAAANACTPTPNGAQQPGGSTPGGKQPGGKQPGGSTPGGTRPVSSPSTSTTIPTGTQAPTTGYGTTACVSAQTRVHTDQQKVATAQQALSRAETTLDQLLAHVTSGSSPTATTNATPSASSSAPSAAQLVADQAAVDAAATNVLAAQETMNQATIASPVDGTIVAASLHIGDIVTAGSTTSTIVIVGQGGYEIWTTVGVNDIAKIKVGDAATVIPDGASQTLPGKVVWIGAATTSTTSTTTYPVVISLTEPARGLRNGAMASTTIQEAQTKGSALTVPTSAVSTTNGLHLVTVLANGKTTSVRVQVGVIGAQTTEITSGLQRGQTVVLADLHAAVPSSNTNTSTNSGNTTGLGGSLTNSSALTGGNPQSPTRNGPNPG